MGRLFSSAANGDVVGLEYALYHLARIDGRCVNKGGMTALHMACMHGHLEVVQILLDRGANVHVRDNNGSFPLHVAAAFNHADVCRLLLEYGADPDRKDWRNMTALEVAQQNKAERAVAMLGDSKAVEACRSLHGRPAQQHSR
jgi:ankyrin repeat protein